MNNNADIEYYNKLKIDRIQTLFSVWDFISESNIIDSSRFKIVEPYLVQIVEHYIEDVKIVKYRYKIPDKMQFHKIAGLMTSLIVRYKPIVLISSQYEYDNEVYINELYAIIHGLSICAQQYTDGRYLENIVNEKWFNIWLNDFLYLLNRRNHTPEALSFVYETLTCVLFRNNLNIEDN